MTTPKYYVQVCLVKVMKEVVGSLAYENLGPFDDQDVAEALIQQATDALHGHDQDEGSHPDDVMPSHTLFVDDDGYVSFYDYDGELIWHSHYGGWHCFPIENPTDDPIYQTFTSTFPMDDEIEEAHTIYEERL